MRDALNFGCGAMAVRNEGNHEDIYYENMYNKNIIDSQGKAADDVSIKLSRTLGRPGELENCCIPAKMSGENLSCPDLFLFLPVSFFNLDSTSIIEDEET